MPSTPLLAAVLPSADCREQGPWRQHPAAQALHHRGHQSQHVMVLALQQLLLPLQPLLLLLAAAAAGCCWLLLAAAGCWVLLGAAG